jgi:type II secretion system protein G
VTTAPISDWLVASSDAAINGRISNSTFSTSPTSSRYMASHRLLIRYFQALGTITYPAVRPAIRVLAVLAIAFGVNGILFSLTVTCVIPAGSPQYALTQVRLKRLKEALQNYRLDCGEYPDSHMALKALVTNPAVKGWNGPYTKEPLRDSWNRRFLYEISGGMPIIRSLGADGKPGSDLFDADLSSLNPLAPPPESRFHAARDFFGFWITPWLVLLTSVYALIRTRPRTVAASAL